MVRNALTPFPYFWFISVSGGMIPGPGTLSGGSETTAALNKSGAMPRFCCLRSGKVVPLSTYSSSPQILDCHRGREG